MKFKEVKLEDKEVFDSFFSKYQPKISELTFTNIFSWRLSKKYKYAIIEEHLVISYLEDGIKKYLQPVGEDPHKAINKIFETEPDAVFEKVERKYSQGLNHEEQRDMFDYFYDMNELRELKGSKYVPKRNFIKRCKKLNPETCTLNKDNVSDFFKLQEEWCQLRGCKKDSSIYAESMAIKEALKHFEELNLFGVCVRIDGKIAGFSIGEKLNDDTFVEHFEKGDNTFVGIYQYVLHEFVNTISGYKYLNREQDLGVEGLRKAKLSYHPLKLIEKYKIVK